MRSLVTGASGFLGGFLVRRLLAEGEQVRCLVRPRADVSALAGLSCERADGDVTDAASLARAVAGVDVVFHLAGIRRAPSREPYFRVNAEGTRRVCEAMVASASARRLVLCSSLAAVGPSTPERAHTEEDPLRPSEWYGESKAEAERIAWSFGDRLEVTVARPPRIFGPQDRENLAFMRLVARGLLLGLTGGPRPLSVVDVEDVVDLLLLLARRPEAVGEAFFVTAPGTLTLERLEGLGAEALGVKPRRLRLTPGLLRALSTAADGVSRLTGRHLPLNRKLAQQLLAPAWTCSGDKAEQVLGFRARRDVAETVRRSATWYRAQGWL
ncbi:MAG: NAD-dependent epimerase/dehydratase family protein [Myxococcaceae bacterium]|nr:NAD-dependent epimerase/dehydratase family protein [Myxococcaceae bacterium]MCI0671467.1 NAD-dependent epimerase/dehydratase family protein [Myxococcaceae bacterium]